MTKRQYVNGFMFDERDDTQLLLLEKQTPAWQKGFLNGVGGKVELTDKSIEDAMQREFYEETGIHHDAIYWRHVITLHGPDYIVYFFSTFGCPTLARQVEAEKPLVVSCNDLPKNVVYNLRWMLPLIRDTSIQFPVDVHDGVKDAESKGTR